MKDIHQIISDDFVKNHANREYDADFVHHVFEKYADSGGEFFRTENVIINHQDIGGGVCEFHCINGGNGKDLTDCVNQYLDAAKSKYSQAVTFYDNPRINEIARFSKYPTTVTKLDQGLDKTYQMTFDLRS